MSKEEMEEEFEWEEQQDDRKTSNDWYWKTFGDGDEHGWSQADVNRYEEWLMSNDPAIRADGSYVD